MAVILNASTSSGFVQSADTSGEINLQSNGTTKLTVASTGVSGTIVQGTAVASTSGTSIDFTGIPSWVKKITIVLDELSTSGTSNKIVRLGTSGGVEATGYKSSGSYMLGAGNGVTQTTVGLLLGMTDNAAATINFTGHMVITLISGSTWVASAVGEADYPMTLASAGRKTLSGTLDRLRITTVNGTDTFDAGTINIQYEG
jgi:hypothetical protein